MGQAESNAQLDPDWWSSPAMPDVLIPEQYAGLLRPFARSPETELLVAVIADAVAVYARHFLQPHAKRQVEFEEAQSWFASASTDGPFCFLNACSALDLDPEAVREALATIPAEHLGASQERWRAVRRGGGRRHSVGPSSAGQTAGSRPAQHAQVHGDAARRFADGSSVRAQRSRGAP